jgi:orotate phosphoribosyltransferase
MDDLQAIAELVRQYVHRGHFELAEGKTTHWYIDGRALLLSPQGGVLAGRGVAGLLDDDVRCVGGPVTAAIPVVSAIVHQSPIPRCGFYVRGEAKGHGLLNQIEGNLEREVAIVDDTCATGGSLIKCIEAVERAGSVVRQVVAVFDRDDGGERIRQLGYDYRYLLRVVDGEPQLPTSNGYV